MQVGVEILLQKQLETRLAKWVVTLYFTFKGPPVWQYLEKTF
jgi:hypothetical protein